MANSIINDAIKGRATYQKNHLPSIVLCSVGVEPPHGQGERVVLPWLIPVQQSLVFIINLSRRRTLKNKAKGWALSLEELHCNNCLHLIWRRVKTILKKHSNWQKLHLKWGRAKMNKSSNHYCFLKTILAASSSLSRVTGARMKNPALTCLKYVSGFKQRTFCVHI